MPITLLERDANHISRVWKCSQLAFHFVAFIGSLVACIPLEQVRYSFHGKCVLNARLSLSFENGKIKVAEDAQNTKWGSNTTCSFCFYTTIISVIYAFVFGWFYAICPRGGKPSRWEYSPRKPWRLVFPSLLFSFHLAVVMIAASTVLMNGVSEFCRNLKDQTNVSCRALQKVPWENAYPNIGSFYDNLVLAELGCWVSAIAWCAIFGVCMLRCCLLVDFIAPRMNRWSATNIQANVLDESGDITEECIAN